MCQCNIQLLLTLNNINYLTKKINLLILINFTKKLIIFIKKILHVYNCTIQLIYKFNFIIFPINNNTPFSSGLIGKIINNFIIKLNFLSNTFFFWIKFPFYY